MAVAISKDYDFSAIEQMQGKQYAYLCKKLTEAAIALGYTHMVTLMRKTKHDATRTVPFCFELFNMDNTFLDTGERKWAAKIDYYFGTHNAKRECVINCWSSMGMNSKHSAHKLANELNSLGVKARATIYQGNTVVAVDWEQFFDITKK
jgi:hypothetical protein